jgi:hypothetical protein
VVVGRGCSGPPPRHPLGTLRVGGLKFWLFWYLGWVLELLGELGVLELAEFCGQAFDAIDEVEFFTPVEKPCIPLGLFGALFEPFGFGLVDIGEQAFDLWCERVCLVEFPVGVGVAAALWYRRVGGHLVSPFSHGIGPEEVGGE